MAESNSNENLKEKMQGDLIVVIEDDDYFNNGNEENEYYEEDFVDEPEIEKKSQILDSKPTESRFSVETESDQLDNTGNNINT